MNSMLDLHTTAKTRYHPLPETPGMESDDALRHVSEAVHRINEAVLRAVNTGVSVELVRISRCHDERGNWGDQVISAIRKDAH
ncbi:MAG: hypothetical protein ACXW30_00970 [Micavibrio sp.]